MEGDCNRCWTWGLVCGVRVLRVAALAVHGRLAVIVAVVVIVDAVGLIDDRGRCVIVRRRDMMGDVVFVDVCWFPSVPFPSLHFTGLTSNDPDKVATFHLESGKPRRGAHSSEDGPLRQVT